ncbi:hypothetical protein GQ55_5G159400 [Panicum hallii var. hallii]|uniref:Uncharacterized protein n=1 Tax=Panicum hallii var. hallii TaxID=1504633 RepID=A0A2T7DGT1_9POAL|nr:hypothetical protein GQ55_5G159400 [Panicum hallii var. hallii]
MKSLKGRLIGGEDLHCEGVMAVLAIHSSFLRISGLRTWPRCLWP